MKRSLMFLFGVGTLLLSGCLCTSALPQAAAQTLTLLYTEKSVTTAEFLEYSDNGQTLIAAGDCCFVNLHDAHTHEKLVALNKESSDEFEMFTPVIGAGFIDDNIWFFGFDIPGNSTVASIRQIEPPHELFKKNFYDRGNSPVITNKDYVAYNRELLNWHDGTSYKVAEAHPAMFGYTMAGESQIMTYNAFNGDVLVHDPVRQEKLFWNTGFRISRMALSTDAKYAAALSNHGKCVLWKLPEKERLGSCGVGGLLDGKLTGAVFQRDSRALAVSVDDEIRVYATQPFKLLMKAAMPKPVTGLALSEGRLAAGDNNGNIRVWNVAGHALLGEYVTPQPAMINKLAFQPGGTRLAASLTSQHLSQLLIFELRSLPLKPAATTP